MTRRLPAEWETQDGVLLAWPHLKSDWAPTLEQVEPVYAEIVKQISRFEKVIVIAAEPHALGKLLHQTGARMENVKIFSLATNDTWTRDFGPITIMEDGSPLLLDFAFNGWGLKFAADKDNRITRQLHGMQGFGQTPLRTLGLVLEGGSIESDGRGTILTTTECLLGPNRNPHLTRSKIEADLADNFGADHFLWLQHGYLAGDDTDSHIDTLARLCPDNRILHVMCDVPEDEHYHALSRMVEELASFRTRDGSRYDLVPLPWPAPRYDEDGQRLPATYANYLVINDAVLVPTYRDKADETALATIRTVYPDREIIGVDCLPLILQHGSLHCITMQLPKGVLP